MANSELGAKQVCPNCQAKFYDLNRRPAVCPKCATEFDPEEVVRSRRVRPRTPEPDYEDDPKPNAVEGDAPEADEDDEAGGAPEIDEAAEGDHVEAEEVDDAGEAAATPDLGVDFEEEGADLDSDSDSDSEDVPFLEEGDEDFADEEIETHNADD